LYCIYILYCAQGWKSKNAKNPSILLSIQLPEIMIAVLNRCQQLSVPVFICLTGLVDMPIQVHWSDKSKHMLKMYLNTLPLHLQSAWIMNECGWCQFFKKPGTIYWRNQYVKWFCFHPFNPKSSDFWVL
jgi:hypothetical protein